MSRTKQKIMCIDELLLDDFALWLKVNRDIKAITINTYIRHVIHILEYGMELGYIKGFKYKQLKEDILIKEIYIDKELEILLKKPSISSFAEYRNWVIVNFLLGTGVGANELRYIKINSVNFDNGMIILERTKNRKQRFIPMRAHWNKY